MTTKGISGFSPEKGKNLSHSQKQQVHHSAFTYTNVDGKEIRENWLAGSVNVADYRQTLLKAFKDSQTRYLQRKKEKRVLNQAENLIPLDNTEDYLTVNPLSPNLALEKRRIIKQSRSIIKKTIERFMVVDDEMMTYFVKENDTKYKKHHQLTGCRTFVESVSNKFEGKWHDKRYDLRVNIQLEQRAFKPIFFYTSDLNEAKSLNSKIKSAAKPSRLELSKAINQISLLEKILKFNLIWKKIEVAYNSKILKIISFQLLGINLIEVAGQAKTQRERLLKYWSNQLSSKESSAAIRSTFRCGNPKEAAERIDPRSSLLVRTSLERLTNLFSTRRVSRNKEVINQLNILLKEEEAGFHCIKIKVIKPHGGDKEQTKQIKEGSLKIENQSTLLIRDENFQSSGDDYYEKNGPLRFDLDQVSCIATDKNLLQDVKGQSYSARIYGKFLKQNHDTSKGLGIHPAEIDLDVLRRVPSDTYTLKINSIEVPLPFANRYHQKGDLRVQLRQSQNVENLDSKFFVRSKPYRIDVPVQLNYIPPNLVIDGETFIFTVDKLDSKNADEQFRLNLSFSSSTIPINNVTKDILPETEYFSKQTFSYQNYQNQIVTVHDKKGNEFKINFSMGKNSSANSKYVDERQGARLLVGRYVIVDTKMIAIVKNLKRDGSVDVQLIKTKEEKNYQVSQVSLIEENGVSTFNLRNLPYLVENSQFTWIIEFTTTRQKLLNVIQSAVQRRQTALSYSLRSYSPLLSDRDIEGKLVVAVLEGRNFITKGAQCNPIVIVATKGKKVNQYKGQETDIIENNNNPSWISHKNPTGKMFIVGDFNKDTAFDETLLFNVINKTEGGQDSIIGSASLKIDSLLDIKEPAKEICLIIEDSGNFGFLIIQTMFVPSRQTRLKFVLREDLTLYKSPEQYLHFKYLQKLNVHDSHNYAVPVCQYRPNLLESIFTQAQANSPQKQLVHESPQKKSQTTDESSLSKLLLSPDRSPDKTSAPQLVQMLNKLSSPEERIAAILKSINQLRPDVEEGVIIFKYLWKYRVSEPKQVAFQELQEKFWQEFLKQVQNSGEYLQNIDQLDMSFTVNSAGQEEGIEKGNEAVGFKGWLQSLGGSGQKQKGQENITKFKLIFKGSWEQANNQKYADYYHLLMNGVPDKLRPLIWKDLLRAQVIEYEEEQSLRKLYGDVYQENLSVYENYKEVSIKSDCLAFRQVDQDIENFEFPKHYYENNGHNSQIIELGNQKRQMRHILRTIIMWSKTKTIGDKAVNFNYTKGLMYIVQRLVTLMKEEEAFWVVNGMIRSIPRFYSTNISCLEGGRQSVMRNEMTIFKAILRENLPELCDKLRYLGLPIEHLIYDSIASLYSNFFASAVVLRLWDLIIFNMSTREKVERRRALWYIMAPAYLILREKQTEIMNAKTVLQVVDIYNSGCVLTYNGDWIVGELKVLIKEIFVKGASQRPEDQTEQAQNDMNYYQLGFSKVQGLMKTTLGYGGDRARQLEHTRRVYEADLSIIFNSIEEENKEIGNLLQITNTVNQKGQAQYLDYVKWRTHVMAKFKKVALKNSDNVIDALYDYDEPDLHKEDLDLSKINIYIHQLSHLPGNKLYKIKIMYGKLSQEGVFLSLEDHYSDDVYNSLKIQQFHIFDYTSGYNSIRFEILSSKDDSIFCELIVDLRDVNANRFAKKWNLMKNFTIQQDTETFHYALTQIEVSYFLQTHTAVQHNQMMSDRNPAMSKFINSIKRKLPDKIDIFNKKNESEFVALMEGDFQRIIHEELQALKCFLPLVQAMNTINDNFNYVQDSDFGDLTLENFQFLVQACFFPEWINSLGKVYSLLTKNHSADDLINSQKGFLGDTQQISSLITGIKTTLTASPQKKQPLASPVKQSQQTKDANKKLPFSLRNFIVSLVLMSHCTLNEKLDILYDLFDWNDGAADGLDLNSVYVLIKTIFERNLYYLPSHELYNLIEIAFDQSVSMVYQAFWTKEPLTNLQTSTIKLRDLINNPNLIESEESRSIDVTEEIQDTLNSYQRMFGTKIIDFNYDSSAFKNIETLLKGGLEMIKLTSKTTFAGKYRLALFCQVSGERNVFEVQYDQDGHLLKNKDFIEKDDLDEYLKRNINKLYLQGRSSGISKAEFMHKTAQIPFLHDLVRVETFYRDRVQSTLTRKQKLNKELVVILYAFENLFVFRFSPRALQGKEGEYKKVENNVYRITMGQINQEDVVSDVRERILNAIISISQKELNLKAIDANDYQLRKQVEGLRSFFVREKQAESWKLLSEFDRLASLVDSSSNNEIVLLFEQSFQAVQQKNSASTEFNGFDCFSLYKHSDQSYEWRLCKIIKKTSFEKKTISSHDKLQAYPGFVYWIEFLHLKSVGRNMHFKRNREEILLSARYAREQQRNFEAVSQKFIIATYSDEQPIVRNKSPVKKTNYEFMQQFDEEVKAETNQYKY